VFIKDCLSGGRVRWTYHVTMRLVTRGSTPETIHVSSATLEIIEAYPQDKYLPSFLVRGECGGVVFHVWIATDLEGENIRVVTTYIPDPDEWDEGVRSRRIK
jgi:hypothetical protein